MLHIDRHFSDFKKTSKISITEMAHIKRLSCATKYTVLAIAMVIISNHINSFPANATNNTIMPFHEETHDTHDNERMLKGKFFLNVERQYINFK